MSKRKSTKHCCFVLFVGHLAHSYPNGLTNNPFVFSFRRKIGYFFRLFV
mgnify:FL=1